MTPELEALERLKPCPFCHNPKLDHVFVELKNDGYEFYCLKVWCHIDEKDGKAVGCDAYFEFTNPTKAGTVLSFNDRPASTPRPWLRAEEVTESGSYWWRNDTSYAAPVTVYVMKSGTDESCFASAGQLGWWKAMQLKDLGGLWQRIPEPELPINQPGGDDGK